MVVRPLTDREQQNILGSTIPVLLQGSARLKQPVYMLIRNPVTGRPVALALLVAAGENRARQDMLTRCDVAIQAILEEYYCPGE